MAPLRRCRPLGLLAGLTIILLWAGGAYAYTLDMGGGFYMADADGPDARLVTCGGGALIYPSEHGLSNLIGYHTDDERILMKFSGREEAGYFIFDRKQAKALGPLGEGEFQDTLKDLGLNDIGWKKPGAPGPFSRLLTAVSFVILSLWLIAGGYLPLIIAALILAIYLPLRFYLKGDKAAKEQDV